jgi:homogentisate phytyltransferase/homogentisate geranylgeranyltransferase
VLAVMLIGSAYSLPPLRLKRRWLWAALSIALARGGIANAGLALHYRAALGRPDPLPELQFALMVGFFVAFGFVIALYKDIPDLAGDQAHGIRSFPLRWGPRRAFDLGRLILCGGYLAVLAAAAARLPAADAGILVASQVTFLALFWLRSRRVEPAPGPAFGRFYLFLWGLFYAQYLAWGLAQLG